MVRRHCPKATCMADRQTAVQTLDQYPRQCQHRVRTRHRQASRENGWPSTRHPPQRGDAALGQELGSPDSQDNKMSRQSLLLTLKRRLRGDQRDSGGGEYSGITAVLDSPQRRTDVAPPSHRERRSRTCSRSENLPSPSGQDEITNSTYPVTFQNHSASWWQVAQT